MTRRRAKLELHPGVRRWAEATEACLALRRAAIRAMSPRASDRAVERRLIAELERARAARLAAYRRPG